MGPGDHLELIDGSGFIFRAYHALPPLTRRSDGMPVGAVQGFCAMLHKMIEARATGASCPSLNRSASPTASLRPSFKSRVSARRSAPATGRRKKSIVAPVVTACVTGPIRDRIAR